MNHNPPPRKKEEKKRKKKELGGREKLPHKIFQTWSTKKIVWMNLLLA